MHFFFFFLYFFFFFQAEDGIRDFCLSRGLGDVYKRQSQGEAAEHLSSLLPELVNKLTPDGQAPQGDLDIGSLLARFS